MQKYERKMCIDLMWFHIHLLMTKMRLFLRVKLFRDEHEVSCVTISSVVIDKHSAAQLLRGAGAYAWEHVERQLQQEDIQTINTEGLWGLSERVWSEQDHPLLI